MKVKKGDEPKKKCRTWGFWKEKEVSWGLGEHTGSGILGFYTESVEETILMAGSAKTNVATCDTGDQATGGGASRLGGIADQNRLIASP